MKVKVVPLSEVGGEKKGGKEAELAQVLSQQSGVGKEGGDEESDQMGDVRVEPVPRYVYPQGVSLVLLFCLLVIYLHVSNVTPPPRPEWFYLVFTQKIADFSAVCKNDIKRQTAGFINFM